MKPEEIIALAKEAGIKLGYVCGKPDQCPDDDNCCHHNTREGFWASDGQLSRFAARIRDMTLEEAARVCDGWTHADGDVCAAAIRDLKGSNK